MSIFLGCCVIAGAILYVGKKIGRLLLALVFAAENIGGRMFPDSWPSREEWDRIFPR